MKHGGEQVHLWAAYETGHKDVDRPLVEILRGCALLQHARFHHRDPVAHGHRLHLVVGDVDGGHPQLVLQQRDLGAHLDPELGVEVGEWLIHQENLGLAHDRSPHGDALPLAPGQVLWLAVQVRCQRQTVRGRLDPLLDVGFGLSHHPQREAHVVAHRHVRVEGVVLEDHRDIALLRGQAVDHPVPDIEPPAGDLLKACGHPQSSGLSASRRTDEDHELTIVDLEAEVGDRLGTVRVRLLDFVVSDRCHFLTPSLLTRRRFE